MSPSKSREVAFYNAVNRKVTYEYGAAGKLTTPRGGAEAELQRRPDPRIFDTYGRLVRYRLGGVVRDLVYDEAGRILGYTHYDAATGAAQPALDQHFGYDRTSRLTSVQIAAVTVTYGYDTNGNRTRQKPSDGANDSYTIEAASNRLSATSSPARSFDHDAAGNTVADSPGLTAGYDLAGRLTTLAKAGVTTTYTLDGMGRRVRKHDSTGPASTVIFVYQQDGRLLGEYDQAGTPLREYVWLGTIPIAMFTPDPAGASNPPLVYYIHADHLGAPQAVLDRSGRLRWSWMTEPFGTTVPQDNPQGLGAFAFELRLPGQYADAESGWNYSYFRDYDPSVGRFVQSDPIGLQGGINTYSYVGGMPTMYTDPSGLLLPLLAIPGVCAAGGCEALIGAGIILMSPQGQKAIQDGAKAIGDACEPGDKDPCKGLRDQLRDHERKLREYMANPMSMDNKGFLSGALAKNEQDLYRKIYMTRIASLQGQIANFKKLLEECERRNGR